MGPLFVLVGASVVVLWVMFFVLSFFIVVALENDSPGWATFAVTFTIALIWFFSDFSTRYHLQTTVSWKIALALAIGYVVTGIIWSFIKWAIELDGRRERWKELITEYKVSKNIPISLPVTSKTHSNELILFIEGYSIYAPQREFVCCHKLKLAPTPNKTRITGWMIYWPWSLLWSIFDDFITGIFKWFYRRLSGGYEAMAKWMFKDIE